MIGPKVAKPTAAEARRAYDVATRRDMGVCQRCLGWCGVPQRDHRKNRSQGGQTVPSNLQLLGEACHRWKTEHPADAVRDGWAVPGHAEPRLWPARRWLHLVDGRVRAAWVLLDDEGGWTQITEGEALSIMRGAEV